MQFSRSFAKSHFSLRFLLDNFNPFACRIRSTYIALASRDAKRDEPRRRLGSSDSPTRSKRSCTHLCASDENTGESPPIFVTRPTCRNSCTLPDGSRGIYFRIGMTPPRLQQCRASRIRSSCRFLSEVRGCLPLESARRLINTNDRRSKTPIGERGRKRRRSIARFPDGQTNPSELQKGTHVQLNALD